jgi:hypothetical protein
MMIEVFTGEDELFDRLLVVSDDAAYVSNPDKEKLADIASKIREGSPIKSVVPDADEIRYAAVSSIKANRFRDDLNIYHQQVGKTRMRNITFKDAARRDAALQALERRLAPRFTRAEVQYGVVRAALAPLLTTSALAALTYVSYMAAGGVAAGEAVDIHGRGRASKRMFAWALELLGPTGVAVVGGLIVLGCIGWLVARVKKPPLMVTLTPRK